MINPYLAFRDEFAAAQRPVPVTLSGRRWGVTAIGAGAPLWLLPDAAIRADAFWRIMPGFKGLRVLALDYPDSGRAEDWVDDLLALMEREKQSRVAILGAGLGGNLGQMLAARAPARISLLVLAGTWARAATVSARPPYDLDPRRAPLRHLRERLAYAAEREGGPAQVLEFLRHEAMERLDDASLRARVAALREAPDLPPIDDRSDGATVIMAVQGDRLLLPSEEEALAARFHNPVQRTFTGGDRWPYLTDPGRMVALLRERMLLPPLSRVA